MLKERGAIAPPFISGYAQGRIYFKQGPVQKQMWGPSSVTADPIFPGKKLATFLVITVRVSAVCSPEKTRNSSGDEIANVNFLYDDIVHALKMQ